MSLLAVAAAFDGGGDESGLAIAVSDIEIESSVGSGACNAGIIFNESGVGAPHTLVKRHSVAVDILMGDDDATVPVDHTGEWGVANSGALYEVACISLTSGTWDTEHAAVGVYTSLDTADMIWLENRTGGKGYTPGTDLCIAQFRIREISDPGGNFDDFEVIARAIQT